VRAGFLLQDIQLSGGVNVVVALASRLNRRHGFDCRIVLTRPQNREHWAYPGLADVPVMTWEEAQAEHFDVVLATWWETTKRIFDLDAERYVWFIQLLEDSTYPPEHPERVAAGLATALPLRFITEARWIAETLEQLQPGNRVHYVRVGLDKEVWGPIDRVEPKPHDDPLRIIIEGNLHLAHKGVMQAIHATTLMQEPRHVTVVSGDPAAAELEGVDEVVSGLSHPQLAELLDRQHLMLKLSRVEGMYAPPLEGFHRGCTVVTTPVTGFDEYIRHRENGLVVGWDDPHGTARALDLLARDWRLLHSLRSNALQTARGWPSWDHQADVMALALRAVAREPPPDPRSTGRRLASDFASTVAELQRADLAYEIRTALLHELWRQKAWQYSVKVRRWWYRLRKPFAWARRKALRR
jgi:glycosyltransferase involved in cell wall biosynthesis